MPVEVRRKNNESLESLLRRFTKKIQQSGLILRAKKGQHYYHPENKRARKEKALRRQKMQLLKAEFKKLGKLEELLPIRTHHKSKIRASTALPSAKSEAQKKN